MAKFFKFTRKQKVKVKDANGNPILETTVITLEDGSTKEEAVPGKFVMEEKTFIDAFNIEKVIRVHRLESGDALVLLDDGHEETQKIPTLKNPNKKGPVLPKDVVEVKERQWVQSEILIQENEVDELFAVL